MFMPKRFSWATAFLLAAISPAFGGNIDPIQTEDPKATAARAHLDTEYDQAFEVNMALTGGPEHLRTDATVYVYKKGHGFKRVKDGSNGFTCLVNRDAFLYGRRNFKPTCWDAVGADSYIPVMLSVGKWLAEGKTTPEIKSLIDNGFTRGEFHEPARAGIAYMVVGDLDLDKNSGCVIKRAFPGHYMFYAPRATNAQFGVSRDDYTKNPKLPRIFAGGAGGSRLAYIITMVGEVVTTSDMICDKT